MFNKNGVKLGGYFSKKESVDICFFDLKQENIAVRNGCERQERHGLDRLYNILKPFDFYGRRRDVPTFIDTVYLRHNVEIFAITTCELNKKLFFYLFHQFS